MLPSVILVLSSSLIITSSYLFLLCALIPNNRYYIYSIVFIRVKSTSFEDYKRFGLNKIWSYITNAAPYNQ